MVSMLMCHEDRVQVGQTVPVVGETARVQENSNVWGLHQKGGVPEPG